MTEQASSPGLKLDSPSQELRRRLENLHASEAKFNFCFQEVVNHQAIQPATNTNPFAALEMDNLEAENENDNHEDLREGWTFQGRKKHTPRIASPKQVLPQSPTPPLTMKSHQGEEGNECTQTCTAPTSPHWVSQLHQTRNTLEQGSGRFCPGKKTPKKKSWSMPRTTPHQASHLTSGSQACRRKNGPTRPHSQTSPRVSNQSSKTRFSGTLSTSRTASPWNGAGRRIKPEEGGNAQSLHTLALAPTPSVCRIRDTSTGGCPIP